MSHGFGLYSEEHEAFRATARKIISTQLLPHAAEWDEAEEFPIGLYKLLAGHGFFGLKYPEAYGGTNAGFLYEAVLIEEMARCGSGGVAAGIGAQMTIATAPINSFGTHEQKLAYLKPAILAEKIGAFAVTEASAGSDVAGMLTTARLDGDHWVLNGSKTYITGGVRADYVIVACKTRKDEGHNGLSMLIVDKKTPGFTVGPKLKKLGWRSSDTGELFFEDCRVPKHNLLGEEGQGFYQIMGNFQWERLALALGAVGAADDILAHAIEYVRQRKAFGRSVSQFQVIRHRLADALRLHIAGEFALGQTAMAKKLATEMCCKIADQSLQLHGGAGYMMEYDIQRHWRDARLGPIGGGTSEIMNEIISKQMGL